jgi:hypothetical protein
MPFIQQSIERTSAPPHIDRDADAQLTTDPPQRSMGQSIELPALETRDRVVAHTSGMGEVDLSPSATSSKGAHSQADSHWFHPSRVGDGALANINDCSPVA